MDKVYILMQEWEPDDIQQVISYPGELPKKEIYEICKDNWDIGERDRKLKELGLEFLDCQIVEHYELKRAAEEANK